MGYDRDKQLVRSVGGLITGLGAILLILTGVIGLVVLFTVPGGNVVPGLVGIATALVMASSMMSCGTQLARLRLLTPNDIDTMRMCWAALILVMLLGAAVAFWYVPPLSLLAMFVVLLLVMIRSAVINLSR